jgi:hypothetical protein
MLCAPPGGLILNNHERHQGSLGGGAVTRALSIAAAIAAAAIGAASTAESTGFAASPVTFIASCAAGEYVNDVTCVLVRIRHRHPATATSAKTAATPTAQLLRGRVLTTAALTGRCQPDHE